MNARGSDKASRWPSLIAIVAMVCLVSALVGSWAVRSAATTPDSPQSVAASDDIIDAGEDIVVDLSRVHLADISQPTSDSDHNGPLSSDQKSYKTAGIKRDRPPNRFRSAPPEWWLPTPSSLIAAGYRPAVSNNRVPAKGVSGQELLNQICVARR